MKQVKQNNPVAKYDFNRGGFHTPKKFVRKVKHKGKSYE